MVHVPTGSIPSEFGMLTVASLGAKKNSLSGRIPSQLGGMTKLSYLNLQSNRLTGVFPVDWACALTTHRFSRDRLHTVVVGTDDFDVILHT
jgi:hypothetical protein